MKRYRPERLDSLLQSLSEELPIIRLYEEEQAFRTAWSTLPDAVLQRAEITLRILPEGGIVLLCPSTVVLNYARRQRPLIERHLASFLQEWNIPSLSISL